MNNQVLSIKEMQELIDMGIDVSKASMYWYDSCGEYICSPNYNDITSDCIPAFTLQDILCILNSSTKFTWNLFESGISITNLRGYEVHCEYNDNSLIAAFNMLKWCKTNNQL